MPSNAKEFAAFLKQQAGAMRTAYMRNVRIFAFKVLEVAINNSPVDTGRLRQGWHLTIGSPSEADKDSKGALTEAESALNKANAGDTIWIQNNVPYAYVWEHGLFDPPNPGPTDWSHIKNKKVRKQLRKGEPTTLVRGGFHVSAPNGMLADAVQLTTEAAKSGALFAR